MIKKTITYTDLDGKEVREDFYFHFNKMELIASEDEESIYDLILTIGKKPSGLAIIKAMREIVKRSFGKRLDGGVFDKGDGKYGKLFVQSEPFSVLLEELVTNADVASEFINGVFPRDLVEKMKDIQAKGATWEEAYDKAVETNVGLNESLSLPSTVSSEKKTADDYTSEELLEMSSEEFHRLVGTDPSNMSKKHLAIAMSRMSRGS